MKLRGKIIPFHCRYERFRSSHHTNRTNQPEDDFVGALKRKHIRYGRGTLAGTFPQSFRACLIVYTRRLRAWRGNQQ
jgi:hypothetical protein